ncbi:EAL domain-containing protein [Enterobacteriaceae bacterium H11S18]|uniref:bifunctional diguanylate cyclase/phosphodiesterase n=1 Tax=Dryocola clanedunensis TaxID=2925396 RepID=UPI0022F0F27A|nr:GGDEF domain-containing protein [Dryocola clanedunensis]MCT4713373.1 EAL domain-containing protein [Dryocola clanedunensis]
MKKLKKYPVSLTKALVILMIISSVVVVMSLNSYLDRAVKNIFADMNEKLLKNDSELLAQRMRAYLNQPHAAGKLMSLLAKDQNSASSEVIEQQLQQLVSLDLTQGQPLSSISFTSANGSYTALQRDPQDGKFYPITSTVQTSQDVLKRLWFVHARETSQPFWTEHGHHASAEKGMAITWRQPIRDPQGNFVGVISAGILPADMSQWLHSLDSTHSHRLMLLNEKGRLIAASAPVSADEMTIASQHLPTSAQDGGILYPAIGHNLMLNRPITDEDGLLKWTLVMLTPDNQWQSSISRYHQHNFMGLSMIITLSLLVITFLMIRFSRPLVSLIDRVHLLGTPLWTTAARGTLFPEVASLANALDNKSRLIMDMLEARQDQIERDKETGLLTFAGLCNHPELYRGRNMIALLHLSNHSSLTNLLGKEYGESLLAHLQSLLKTLLPADTILCRERTDKILMIFPEIADSDQAALIQQQLETLFLSHQATSKGRHELLIAGNAGIVEEPLTSERLKALVLNAGIALHHARKEGNGVVTRFAPEMHELGLRNVELHEELSHALERNEFHLVMQPIVSLAAEGECLEGECLVRWNSPTLGFVPPDRFIALAEQTGLIIPLGYWIIETACGELADFITRGAPANFKLHINISPLQLQQDDFAQELLGCLQRYHLQGANICIELTEGVLLDDANSVLPQLNTLREAGVTVSLDDFGSGYSSLSYLHALPFDQLKIDRQFVSDILEDRRSESVIASVLSLANSFKVPLVAEGIEDEETGEKLRNMGCLLAQGYHYGRPQPFKNWTVKLGVFKLTLI